MKIYLLGWIGLAFVAGSPLLGQAGTCGNECGCPQASCGCTDGCCDTACYCCPKCGCRLVPVCHNYCDVKKVTEHKYSCRCEAMCVPGPVPLCCDKCGGCDKGSGCAGGCDTCDNGCQDGCGCRCTPFTVRKLVTHPCVKEVPVRKCAVEWVCPHCSNCGQCGSTAAPTAAPVAPQPVMPVAPMPVPRKTTDVTPLPSLAGALGSP